MVDYYKILGVARDASARDISTSYKKLALKYHPDKSDNTDKSLAYFQQIQEAIEVLRDPVKKEKYDKTEPRFEWEKVVDDIYNDYSDAWATWDPEDPDYQEFAAWEEARYKQTWHEEGEAEDTTQSQQQQQQQQEEEEEEEEQHWRKSQKEWRQKRAEAMRARIIRDEENLNTDEDKSEIFSKIPIYECHVNGSTTTEEDADLLQNSKYDSHLDSYPLIDLSDPPEDDHPGGQYASGIQELLGDNGWVDNEYIEAVVSNQQTTSQGPYERLSRFLEYKLCSGRYHQENMQAEIAGLYLESMQQCFMDLQMHHMDDNVTCNPEGFRQCHHLGPWEKHLGAEECDVCGIWRPLYTMSCPACKVKACVGCKYEKNNEELI